MPARPGSCSFPLYNSTQASPAVATDLSSGAQSQLAQAVVSLVGVRMPPPPPDAPEAQNLVSGFGSSKKGLPRSLLGAMYLWIANGS